VWQLIAWLNPVVTGCYPLLRASITRCAVLRVSLCICIVAERCDLTVIKGKIYFILFYTKCAGYKDEWGYNASYTQPRRSINIV